MRRFLILIFLSFFLTFTLAKADESTCFEEFVCEDTPCETIPYDELYPNIETPLHYNFNQVNKIKGAVYKQQNEQPGTLSAKIGNVTLQSSSSKGKSDYMKDNLRQRTELKLDKKYFELSTGMETKYESSDASKYSQNMFLAPKLKLGNRFSLFYDSRLNTNNLSTEQGLGVNYKPKYIKNTSFGVYSGSTYQNGLQQSQKTKFISDFYLW